MRVKQLLVWSLFYLHRIDQLTLDSAHVQFIVHRYQCMKHRVNTVKLLLQPLHHIIFIFWCDPIGVTFAVRGHK